ncbi:MAG TPA: NAAT family transporter [Longimicrobiales bacterium]|nr:NAAT family transporter [Longimicrobiales bacterium]
MRDFVLFFVSLFSIVNPLSAIPAYVSLTADVPVSDRRRLTRQAATAVFVILVTSYVAGESLLRFFGISVASLRVAGGLLILGMAWSMLQARMSPAKQTPEEAQEVQRAQEGQERPNIGVVPLAMPLLSGPGSISLMIIVAGRTDGLAGHAGVVGAVLAVAALAWVILSAAGPIAKALGRTGMNVATRFMGLILAAIAVEFITSGLAEIFPGWKGTQGG